MIRSRRHRRTVGRRGAAVLRSSRAATTTSGRSRRTGRRDLDVHPCGAPERSDAAHRRPPMRSAPWATTASRSPRPSTWSPATRRSTIWVPPKRPERDRRHRRGRRDRPRRCPCTRIGRCRPRRCPTVPTGNRRPPIPGSRCSTARPASGSSAAEPPLPTGPGHARSAALGLAPSSDGNVAAGGITLRTLASQMLRIRSRPERSPWRTSRSSATGFSTVAAST